MPQTVRGCSDSGAVAQLGERQLCKLDVVGSIPISSTSFLRAVAALRKRSLTSAYEG